jgi:hypothetical protein
MTEDGGYVFVFGPVCFLSLPPRDSTALEMRLEGRFLSRAKDEEEDLSRGDLNATFSPLAGALECLAPRSY